MNKTLVPLQSSDSSTPINNKFLKIKSSYRLPVSQFKIKQIFLQVIPITLIGNSCCSETDALLDSRSNNTLIHKNIVKNLGLKGGKKEISRSCALSQDIKILGWCPAGPVLPHGEKVPL